MDTCLNCKEPIEQIKGKRKKTFCDSTCRSNYWQKQNRKQNKAILAPISVRDVENHQPDKKTPPIEGKITATVNVKNFANQPKSNYSINTRPVRSEGEDSLDYAARVNEWKLSQK
jgi:hypothetical protein